MLGIIFSARGHILKELIYFIHIKKMSRPWFYEHYHSVLLIVRQSLHLAQLTVCFWKKKSKHYFLVTQFSEEFLSSQWSHKNWNKNLVGTIIYKIFGICYIISLLCTETDMQEFTAGFFMTDWTRKGIEQLWRMAASQMITPLFFVQR